MDWLDFHVGDFRVQLQHPGFGWQNELQGGPIRPIRWVLMMDIRELPAMEPASLVLVGVYRCSRHQFGPSPLARAQASSATLGC